MRSFFREPAPSEVRHRAYELVLMRAAFAVLIYLSIRWDVGFRTQDRPNGIANWLDLTFFSDPAVMAVIQPVTILCLAAYVLGMVPWLALTWVSFVAIGVGTLVNSQGSTGHGTQMVSMMILAQCIVHWTRPRLRTLATTENRAVQWSRIVIAGSYLVCGMVKVIRSDGLWVWNSPMLALQFAKAHQREYFDYLDTRPVEPWVAGLPELIASHPNLSRLVFGSALGLELLCFLALLGRKWSLSLGLALIAMHSSISRMMKLDFEYHMIAIAIFLVNVPYWVREGWRKTAAKARA